MIKSNLWRLPTIQEFLSIVDYTKYDPCTPDHMNFKSDSYLSSTIVAAYPKEDDKWTIFFEDGETTASLWTYADRYNIRLIRTLEDGTLEWASEDLPNTMTPKEVKEYLDNLYLNI